MSSPFFSVVIPTFNRFEFCSKAIDSVLRQNFTDFEIIVVDDCGRDSSYENLLKKYLGNRKVSTIKNSQNLERGASRNIGMNKAKGAYISFLDSDDTWEPDHLSTLKSEIDNSRPCLLATKFTLESSTGEVNEHRDFSGINNEVDFHFFLSGNPIACNFTVKNDLSKIVPFENSKEFTGFEDWIFLFLNTIKHPLKVIDCVTVRMADHSDRSMRNEHAGLIRRRNNATKLIEERVTLTEAELKKLHAGTNYFNSVHAYLGDFKNESFKYLLRSLRGGFNINQAKQALRIAFF